MLKAVEVSWCFALWVSFRTAALSNRARLGALDPGSRVEGVDLLN